ncbi:MAG: Lrp/AsnC family transcriptional regulator [Chitinispirillaceae bacterium]|nr:Lrp/AsnC family transcriptional regulator [Chitinispirillaceae bacterium]
MTRLERDLLTLVQSDFPLEPRPFAALAARLDTSERRVTAALKRLMNAGILRAIRPVISWHALGLKTVLVGMTVAPERIDAIARAISRIDGVTHNYSRAGTFNLWFTLIYDLTREKKALFDRLCRMRGVLDMREFRAEKTYKLGLVLDV